MVMPVMQRCPICGVPFMGSDAVGDPCSKCRVALAPKCPGCGEPKIGEICITCLMSEQEQSE